jgi:hypothetical protein
MPTNESNGAAKTTKSYTKADLRDWFIVSDGQKSFIGSLLEQQDDENDNVFLIKPAYRYDCVLSMGPRGGLNVQRSVLPLEMLSSASAIQITVTTVLDLDQLDDEDLEELAKLVNNAESMRTALRAQRVGISVVSSASQ